MPKKKTVKRAQKAKREGKSPSTQAGEFVREEIRDIRKGKHGARSAKQAIAIGLSKARRAGVDLPPPEKGETSEKTRQSAKSAYRLGHGGAPKRKTTAMALDMLAAIEMCNLETEQPVSIRIGIHTGPAVAGVIGVKKFVYDVWGDTVNTASRLESSGLPGRIQLSEQAAALLDGNFVVQERGTIELKGKGCMKTYWLVGRSDGAGA